MKRLAFFAGPFLLVVLIVATAVVIHRRRASRRVVQAPRLDVSVPDKPPTATGSANAGASAEVLAGYDERREEDEEARHGAVLHIDIGRLSVGQI
jgi:hypothetical protein